MATISDRRLGVQLGTTGTVDYYNADVKSSQSYYSGGFEQPAYGSPYSSAYSYGFGNMLKDNEWQGNGNSYEFGGRTYDPRIMRWRSNDKVKKPYLSPYQFARNSPIMMVDPNGEDEFYFNIANGKFSYKPTLGPNRFFAYAPGLVDDNGQTVYYRLNPHNSSIGSGINDFALTYTHTIYICWPVYTNIKDSHFESLAKYARANPVFYELLKRSTDPKDQQLASMIGTQVAMTKLDESLRMAAGLVLLADGAVDILKASPQIFKSVRTFFSTPSSGFVVRGSSGAEYTSTKVADLITATGEAETITLYRGVSGTEGSTGLYLTTNAEYAASYSSQGVIKITVDKAGFNFLESEGIISSKTGYNITGSAVPQTEYIIQDKNLVKMFLDAKE